MPDLRRFVLLSVMSSLALLAAAFLLSDLPVAAVAAEPSATGAQALEEMPRVPPTEPANVQKTLRVKDGFTLDLLAAEPLTTDPVAIEYDPDGRAWIVEMSDYPYTDKSTDKPNVERLTDAPIGKLRVLEDVDGDGKFDKSTIFARNLSWPTGLAFWKQGVFVAATPDIWYFEDIDGDLKADIRRKVFTGFRKYNVQAVMNNLKWGLDHRIYGAGSSNGGKITRADQPDAKPITLSRNDFRFDAEALDFETISGGARFGNAFDDWGNRFVCNIRNPAQHVVLPNEYLARNPYLPVRSALHDAAAAGDTLPVYRVSPPEPWRAIRARRWLAESGQSYPRSELAAEGYFTSSSGITVYRGAAYPKQYYGQLFLGEVAGNMVHRQSLEPDGVTFKAERIDEKSEFVASTDNWFRAVNFVNAPDGTLHVLDMYRETIEHPWSIPDDIKAHLDLESGRDRGRIYRLSPPGFKVPKQQPRLSKASTTELVAVLENPNSWWRDTAHRLLYERQDPAAVAPLKQLLRKSDSPLARLHAVWSLQGMKELGDDDLLVALNDASGGVREHAVRLAEPRLEKPKLLSEVLKRAEDDEPRVRFQTAFTLGETSDPRAVPALAAIARRDGDDDWIRTAVLSSCAETADALVLELLADADYARQPSAPLMVRSLCTIVGAKRDAAAAQRVVGELAQTASADSYAIGMAAISGMGEGFKRGRQTLSAVFAKNPAAAEWVTRLIGDAQKVALDDALAPPQREAAISLLAYVDFEAARPAIERLIDPRQPQRVQAAAVRILAGFVHPDVAAMLLSRWSTYTPPLRTEVVEALAARADRVPVLLDAIESRKISASDISPTRRTLLLRHADLKLRERAAKIFAHDAPSPRGEVIAQYQGVLKMASDTMRGQKIFERECLACHKLGEKGNDVGPNLATIRHRTPQEVLAHVLDPNREVAPNYLEYIVAIDDGRIITGLIASETATSISLRAADNKQETILRQNIDEIQSTGKSLMPEGFEKKIPEQEMADLLAFLLGLR